MILAGSALGAVAVGAVGAAISVNFVELSAQFALSLSLTASLTIANKPVGISTFPPAPDLASNLIIAANNKRTTTTAELSLSGLELTVADASSWPESGAVTLDVAISARTPTSSEIVYYNGRAGNVLTLDARAQGGTIAKLWPVGSSVEMRYTAEHHNLHSEAIIALQNEVNTKATAADITALDASKLDIAGGTMTGAIVLAGAPALPLHAASKSYVDAAIVGVSVYNARTYGCVGDGVTDDTDAINALNTLVFNAGGGRIYFPKGEYIVGGPATLVNGFYQQILIPVLPIAGHPPKTIEWIGEIAPPATISEQDRMTGDSYSIIKSTLTGGFGDVAFIGGPPGGPGGTTNALTFNLKDMVFEVPVDPTFTALDFQNQLGNRIEHVVVYDGISTEAHPEPTHSNSYGVKLSPYNHSSRVDVISLNVLGFYTGVKSGELAFGTMIAQGCKIALEIPLAYHPTHFALVGAYGCAITIKATGNGPCAVLIDLLSMQDNGGFGDPWQDRIYNIDDPGNYLHGRYNWSNVQAGTGVIHDLINNGGTNFIGTEVW